MFILDCFEAREEYNKKKIKQFPSTNSQSGRGGSYSIKFKATETHWKQFQSKQLWL
jgi:hypothetical protein